MKWRNFLRDPTPYFRKLAVAVGLDLYLDKNDRKILEGIVLPWIAEAAQFRRVLFVGCEWYTRGYRRLFEKKEYWTLEMNSALRKYGAKNHITDTIQNAPTHFQAGYFDTILCYGLIGYGINDQVALVQAIQACAELLRRDGLLVLGWDEEDTRTEVCVDDALPQEQWRPYNLPPLGTASYLTPNQGRHTFRFYVHSGSG
jgi:hypothetical protein